MFAPSCFFIPGLDDQGAVSQRQGGGDGVAHGWLAHLLSRGLEERLEAVNMPFFLCSQGWERPG